MKPSSGDMPSWRVFRIAAKGQEICELRAKTAQDAVKRAIKEHNIEPRWQSRLMAYQVLR